MAKGRFIAPPADASKMEFVTGAVRSADANAFRFDLVSPIAFHQVEMNGGWPEGIKRTEHQLMVDALFRIYCFLGGDRDSQLPDAAILISAAIAARNGAPKLTKYIALMHGLTAVAEACREGAVKYDDFNWEKGMPAHDLLNHAIRHIALDIKGDTSEPHRGHALWNVFAAIHSYILWPQLNEHHLRKSGCIPPGVRDPRD